MTEQTTDLLSDARRFMEYFEDMLSVSAMYTYSALQLTPASTRLYQQYASKFEDKFLRKTWE